MLYVDMDEYDGNVLDQSIPENQTNRLLFLEFNGRLETNELVDF